MSFLIRVKNIISIIIGSLLICSVLNTPASATKEAPKKIFMIHWSKAGRTILGETFIQYMKDRKLNVEIIERFSEQDLNKVREFVKEAKQLRPDLLYVYGTGGAIEAVGPYDAVDPQKHVTDIPTVLVSHSEPVGAKIIKEINKPTGRNATGVGLHVPTHTIFNIMKSFKPGFKTVATLSNPHEANSRISIESFAKLDAEYSMKTTSHFYETDKDKKLVVGSVEGTVKKILESKPDMIYLPSEGMSETYIDTVMAAFVKYKDIHHAPIFTTLEFMLRKPNTCTFGLMVSFHTMGLMAAQIAEDILFNGKKVQDIPYETGTQMTLAIRKDTMNALQTYPTLSFLESAEIFE